MPAVQSTRSTASPTVDRPTVFLACAGEDAPALAPVVRALVGHGVRIDVVGGVDLDMRPLEQALERHRTNAMWVLCRSVELDDYQLDLLTLTVRAAEVPDSHIVKVPFDPKAPISFVAAVRRKLQSVGLLEPPRLRLGHRQPTIVGMPGPRPGAGASGGQTYHVSRPASSTPSPPPAKSAPAVPRSQPQPEPEPVEHSAPVPVVEPELLPDVEVPMSGSTMIASRPRSRRWRRIGAGVGAGVALSSLAAVLVGAMTVSEPTAGAVETTADEVPVAAASQPEARDVAAREKPTMPEPSPDAAEQAPSTEAPEVEVVEQDAARDPSNAEVANDEGEEPALEGPAGADDALMTAFTQGRIRGLDLLLVTYPVRKWQRRADAVEICEASGEGGLDGWRLPTVDELSLLGEAGFLLKYSSWWIEGRGHRRAMWTGQRATPKGVSKRSRARLVCVTDRPRAG